MKDIKVSILIPVYNSEKYIDRCINSILHQTFQSYEVIIINDGSTDSTEQKIKDKIQQDGRFTYIKTMNRGVSAARQKALQCASGDYIIFVDSDDWIACEMIEDMYRQCVENDVDGVCAGIVIETKKKAVSFLPTSRPCDLDALFFLELFYKRKFISTLKSYMLKRYLWDEFVFPENISVGEDMAGLVYVLERANRIYAMNKAYYHYCQHEESIVHSNLTEGKINAYYFEKEMQKKILKLIPSCKNAVDTWYVQNKIYLLSAMGRSKDFRGEIVSEITSDFRKHLPDYIGSEYLTLPYKISLLIIAISGKMYYWIYKFIFHHIRWVYKQVSKND